MKVKEYIKNHIGLFIRIGILLLVTLFFIILLILKTNQDICEAWSRGFARWYQTALGPFYALFPFSLTEFVVVTIVITSIVLLVLVIIHLIKKKWSLAISRIVTIGLIIMSTITIYTATSELAYNRKNVPIPLYQEKVEKSEFSEIVYYFIDDFNECISHLEFDESGEVKEPYTLSEMNEIVKKEYLRLDNDYFTSFTTNVKPMLSSRIYTEFHITGVTFTPMTEANYNFRAINSEHPYTLMHEVAHTKGVMREDEANLVAAYLCLTSDDYYFRYSGYYRTIQSLIDLMKFLDEDDSEYWAARDTIDWAYYECCNYSFKYWDEHNKGVQIGEFFNNLYLKSSGQKEGVDSYKETPIEIDEETEEIISFSTYQKLYFELFYSKNLI